MIDKSDRGWYRLLGGLAKGFGLFGIGVNLLRINSGDSFVNSSNLSYELFESMFYGAVGLFPFALGSYFTGKADDINTEILREEIEDWKKGIEDLVN